MNLVPKVPINSSLKKLDQEAKKIAFMIQGQQQTKNTEENKTNVVKTSANIQPNLK